MAKKKMTAIEEHANTALDFVRAELAKTSGSELEVYRVFKDVFEDEVYGWDMRIQELQAESE